MKFFKTHQSQEEYEEYIEIGDADEIGYPRVDLIEGEEGCAYLESKPPHDYSLDYLTVEALGSGEVCFNIWYSMGTDMITSISYSTDSGNTWTTTNNTNNKESNLQIIVEVEEGDKVLWKGIATQTGYYDQDDHDEALGSFFSSDCEFNAYGNVMSLLYGDDFIGQNSLNNTEYIFTHLFYDFDGENDCQIVSAVNLILPSTTLTENCYSGMFGHCSSLTTPPRLPATTLAERCYYEMFSSCTSLTTAPTLNATTLANNCYFFMFKGCTSLTTAPELPATTLANYCYSGMFWGCTALTTPPRLPAITLAERCYDNMFKGCTSLTSAPELPATTLTNYCYTNMFAGCVSLTAPPVFHSATLANYCCDGMFVNCTSLTTAPELPATTLAQRCYYRMFSGCTSLTTIPSNMLPATTLAGGCYSEIFIGCTSLTTIPSGLLPSTTLAVSCYDGMFKGCTSLTTAPTLNATTLANYCYSDMFKNCSNLSYIKAMFTSAPSNSYTQNWVSGVAATGTFVKNSAATWNVTGVNGIPSGWTVQTASE